MFASVAAGRTVDYGHLSFIILHSSFLKKSRLTKIRTYGYILSMRNVRMLRGRRRQVKTGQIGPAEKGAETPPNPLSEPLPIKVNKGH
jgi:hypothetical protein